MINRGLEKAMRILGKIHERVGGHVLISKRGVPYLRVTTNVTACYFGRTHVIRVFEPSDEDGPGQKRTDFKQWQDAATYLRSGL